MKKQVVEGRQCYIICPMVEESEESGSGKCDGLCRHASGRDWGKGLQVDYLHGKDEAGQKKIEIMERFCRK